MERADAAHFDKLLSTERVKQYIKQNSLKFPDVQVVNASTSIATDSYTENHQIQQQQLFAHHREGATIIVSEVHKKFDAIADLCLQVNKKFQLTSQANAYLSPPGNQGFHPHFDTHDVFVLQVAGRKTFRFYPSDIELPFPDDTYHPDNNPGGDAVEQVELSAGDTLYIPRGIVHDAQAHDGEPSLHITLGVFPFVVRDLLQEMVQVAAENNEQYRAFVDLRPPSGDVSIGGVANLQTLIAQLTSDDIYREALSRLADAVAVDSGAAVAGVAIHQTIADDALLSIEESSLISGERLNDQFKLRLTGQVLRFFEPFASAVELLAERGSMPLNALPGLDADQRQALCTRLLEAGAAKIQSS